MDMSRIGGTLSRITMHHCVVYLEITLGSRQPLRKIQKRLYPFC